MSASQVPLHLQPTHSSGGKKDLRTDVQNGRPGFVSGHIAGVCHPRPNHLNPTIYFLDEP